jgi:ubiquinone/menaquinone biosynthesis C-methylase UbiE
MEMRHKPRGSPHQHSSHGSGGHLDQPRLHKYAAAILFLGQRRRVYDRLIALSGAREGDTVLDVGCGTGYLTQRAANAVGPTGRVVGLDPDEPAIAYARSVARPNCDFHVTGGEAIPEAEGSFDVVVSSLAVHHIPVQERPVAMREMYRVLRPGGRLLIADFRPPHNRAVNRLIGALSGPAMQHNPIDQLAGLIADAGFEVTGSGDQWPWLRYIQAQRSSGPSVISER